MFMTVYDRPAIQAIREARTFFFLLLLLVSSAALQSDRVSEVCNFETGYVYGSF